MVSIIVPIFNCSRTLKRCVDSIFRQTVADWQLILVDDGSTDPSGMLCDEYATQDSRVSVLHKANGGVSSARNAAFALVRGEYIVFCDGDDELMPDYLQLLLQTAAATPEHGHIWCGMQAVYEDAPVHGAFSAPSEELPIRHCTLREYMTLHEHWLDTSPCNKLYQTALIREKGLRFPEDLSLGEDWIFNLAYLDASQNDQIAVITKPLYFYHRGSGESLDTRYRSDLAEIYSRLNTACLTHLRQWKVPQEEMEKFYRSRFSLYEKVLYNAMRAPDMSLREKLAWNNAFLQNKMFCEALREGSRFVHPLYLAAYRSGRFVWVLLLDRLRRIKNATKKHRKEA